MLEVSNVRLSLDAGLPEGAALIKAAAAKALGVPAGRIESVRMLKRSVDARKKHDVHFVATLGVALVGGELEDRRFLAALAGAMSGENAAGESSVAKANCGHDVSEGKKSSARTVKKGARARKGAQGARRSGAVAANVKLHEPYTPLAIPDCTEIAADADFVRPVVVGAGPAGLFAALYLARAGLRPLVLERGGSVDERAQDVAAFQARGVLDPDSNVQFGEGGAGTFSDGKLTTNTKNPYTKHVLRLFADAGAPEEILWQAHPHIGSDRLPSVVATLREEIIARGGDVRFHARFCGVRLVGGRVASIEVENVRTGARETLPARQVVVACGHSARDVFELLHDAGFLLEPKPFSVGVRIEHPQRLINEAQWGAAAAHPALGAAEYKLAVHLPNGRGVYTFCMCPGGEVVCAASEADGVVVNGMSNFARDGENANSAVLVGVGPEDFEGEGPLAGVAFQRRIERAAYQAARAAALAAGASEADARYRAPAQTVGDFLAEAADARKGRRFRRCERKDAASSEGAEGAGMECPLSRAGESQPAASAEACCAPNAQPGFSRPADDAGAETARPARPSASVRPTYARGVAWCSLRSVLPGFVSDAIADALPLLDRRLKGFADADAVMTGVETRSSSPVRIVRQEDRQAWTAPSAAGSAVASGVYPCGEGAGYAGGIMSAAVDGLRTAEAIVRSLADEA